MPFGNAEMEQKDHEVSLTVVEASPFRREGEDILWTSVLGDREGYCDRA